MAFALIMSIFGAFSNYDDAEENDHRTDQPGREKGESFCDRVIIKFQPGEAGRVCGGDLVGDGKEGRAELSADPVVGPSL